MLRVRTRAKSFTRNKAIDLSIWFIWNILRTIPYKFIERNYKREFLVRYLCIREGELFHRNFHRALAQVPPRFASAWQIAKWDLSRIYNSAPRFTETMFFFPFHSPFTFCVLRPRFIEILENFHPVTRLSAFLHPPVHPRHLNNKET